MKQKMSQKKFMAIMIPIAVFLIALAIAATIAATSFAPVLDNFVGRGQKHIIKPEGTENWDTDYCNQKYETAAEAKLASLGMNEAVCDEGMVLLKNDGVLPLKENSKITPFGRGYAHPVYNGNASGGSIKFTSPDGNSTVSPAEALGEKFTLITAAADKQPADMGRTKGFWTNVNGSWIQPITYSGYPDAPGAAEGTSPHNIDAFGGDNYILELDASVYDDIPASTLGEMKNTPAVVFITRAGNENADKKSDAYTDGTRHYLELSKNEKNMIAYAKQKCASVVLVVVSSNPVELAPVTAGDLEVNAIVWAGHPGDNGFTSLAKILSGEVNPSGRLVDLFATDFLKTPSFKNWGDFYYENATYYEFSEAPPHSAGTTNADGKALYYRPYVEYEEGMYNGYRYYETAHDIDASGFVYGELDGKGGVKTSGEVLYPFGYGLSYTNFTYETQWADRGEDISVTVKVTNTGDAKGKEVVQVYYNSPYTELDRQMKIEKPTANLVAFAKTGVIEPGDSDTVVIDFSKEEMTSYCYTRDNGDGTRGCYMLEAGDYALSVRKNSHEIIESHTWSNHSTIWYDNSNPRRLEKDMQAAMTEDGTILDFPAKAATDKAAKFIAATNLFPEMSDYMNDETSPLTRNAWNANFCSGPSVRSKSIKNAKYIEMFGIEQSFDSATNAEFGNVSTSKVYVSDAPASKQDNGLSVLDMRGKDFYDENWPLLLDQIDWDADKGNIIFNFCHSNYFTQKIASIGLPESNHCEGANGVRVDDSSVANAEQLTASWCMVPMMASTWNVELMEDMGDALGQEALVVNRQGRMSPPMNLHRSPFAGRVFEYFSEDPVLTGKVATAIVNGTSNAGMFDYIKHFGMNEQEMNRSKTLHTWATEQVARELYNKPFEMCIRDARKTVKYTADENGTIKTRVMRGCSAMMIAQNAFGPVTALCNYNLVTKLVREEWGFNGLINGDMYNWPDSKGIHELFLRAGCDTWLAWNANGEIADYDSATARTVMRNAIHHIAYTIANSSVLQNSPPGTIIYYDISPWVIWLIVLNVVIYVGVAAMVTMTVIRFVKNKKHPEKYKGNKKTA